MRVQNLLRLLLVLGLLLHNAAGQACRKLALTGEVSVGQQWSASVGNGWLFRLVPIADRGKGYTGWDLDLGPEQGGGYPDALLLGTPPYGSLNEHEIGTTFGLRAQDAIAWGPRRFHFLTTARDLARGRELFRLVTSPAHKPGVSRDRDTARDASTRAAATTELLAIVSRRSGVGFGELTVVDAKLVLGVGDPAPFAQQWATRLGRVPHTSVPVAGQASAFGELRWIRFMANLWLPESWPALRKLPAGSTIEQAKCPQ